MRLKGRFRDPVTFLRIMQTMAKLSSRCILRFSPDKITVVIARGMDSTEAWAELDDVGSFFEEYVVESNNANEINVEVATDVICQALRLTTSASRVVIKLAKDGKQALLNIDIATKSHSGQDVSVSHNVHINVKRARDMMIVRTADEAIAAQNYNLTTAFPDLAEVRTVAEHMRNLDIAAKEAKIGIAANMQGQLRISVLGEEVNVEACWNGLHTDREAHDQANLSVAARQRFHNVRVDARSFARLLASQVTDYSAEMWMANKVSCVFLTHVRKPGGGQRDRFVGHIMVILPHLGVGDD